MSNQKRFEVTSKNPADYGKCLYLEPHRIVDVAEALNSETPVLRPAPHYILKALSETSFYDVSYAIMKIFNPVDKVLRLEVIPFNPFRNVPAVFYDDYINKYFLSDEIYATKFYEGYKDEYLMGFMTLDEMMNLRELYNNSNIFGEQIRPKYVVMEEGFDGILDNLINGYNITTKNTEDECKANHFKENRFFKQLTKEEYEPIKRCVLPTDNVFMLVSDYNSDKEKKEK